MFLFWLSFLLVLLAYSLRTTEGIRPESMPTAPTKRAPKKTFRWDYLRNSDFPDVNLRTYGDVDLTDCQNICEKDSSCVAIVRPVNINDYIDGQCILKKAGGVRKETKMTNAYLKIEMPPT